MGASAVEDEAGRRETAVLKSKVRSRKSKTKSQKSGVKNQKPEGRRQKSKTKSQESGGCLRGKSLANERNDFRRYVIRWLDKEARPSCIWLD